MRVLYIIDSLWIGGAEILLKNSIEALPSMEYAVVYLTEPATLKEYFKAPSLEFHCLNHKGWKDLPVSIRKLRAIINQFRPDIVHSHLFVSTVIARLSVPKNIPLATTLHSILSYDAFEKNVKSLWAEKFLIRKRHSLISVSKAVLVDYKKYVNVKGKNFVLYNFIPEAYFKSDALPKRSETKLKCIAVGTLKEAKNYSFLLDVFKHLKNEEITLDIFGDGDLRLELQEEITRHGLKIELKGSIHDTSQVLQEYDLFLQASKHEGFGLTVIEAIACRLPVYLSDLPVFREITADKAHFFALNDTVATAEMLKRFCNDRQLLNEHVEEAFDYALSNYSKGSYINKLQEIYEAITIDHEHKKQLSI